MRTATCPFRLALALGAALGLAACSGNSAPSVDIDVVGTENAPFEGGARLSAAGQLVRAATAEGLVALDEQGRVIPALADRWIVTDDGLSYIFRLRDGTWPDGTPITGESARAALRQALSAIAQTPLGREFAGVEDIRAMAGRVVEIRLAHPLPDLIQLLAQPELGLMQKGRGSGPMVLKREGPLALLSPIPPEKLGLPQPPDWALQARSVRLHAVPANVAARRFADGEVDVVLGGRFESWPLADSVAGLSRRVLRYDPVPGLFGLVVVQPSGPLAVPELREALAMAIDRDALAAAIAPGGWGPTTRIVGAVPDVSPGPAGERWSGLSPAQRKGEAGLRIGRWKARHGAVQPLRLALPEGPGADRLFVLLAGDLAAIGVPVQRVGAGDPADLQLLDLAARYPRPDWFLNQLTCAARRGLCSAAADALLAQAAETDDPARRAALLSEAEAGLAGANTYIPLGSPVRWSLVRDRVSGFAVNATGFHPLAPLALRPH